jgi:rhodanese-related sulfurtransferase
MLSKKQLRNDIKVIEVALKKRNFSFDASALSALEDRRKKNFSGKDACKLLANGAQLVDVRSSSEFSQGALPNAINLPSRWFLVMRQQINAIAPPISSMVLTWVLCHLFNSFSGKDACKLLADGAQLVDVRSSSEFLKPSLIKSSRWFLVMRQQMNAIAPPISSMVLTWVLCHLLFTRIQTVYRTTTRAHSQISKTICFLLSRKQNRTHR